jgi:hypothetical protein
VKDKHLYEKQRDEGNSKEKSARMANAAANTSRKRVGRQGGSSSSYDGMTKEQLMKRAREVGSPGARRCPSRSWCPRCGTTETGQVPEL